MAWSDFCTPSTYYRATGLPTEGVLQDSMSMRRVGYLREIYGDLRLLYNNNPNGSYYLYIDLNDPDDYIDLSFHDIFLSTSGCLNTFVPIVYAEAPCVGYVSWIHYKSTDGSWKLYNDLGSGSLLVGHNLSNYCFCQSYSYEYYNAYTPQSRIVKSYKPVFFSDNYSSSASYYRFFLVNDFSLFIDCQAYSVSGVTSQNYSVIADIPSLTFRSYDSLISSSIPPSDLLFDGSYIMVSVFVKSGYVSSLPTLPFYFSYKAVSAPPTPTPSGKPDRISKSLGRGAGNVVFKRAIS